MKDAIVEILTRATRTLAPYLWASLALWLTNNFGLQFDEQIAEKAILGLNLLIGTAITIVVAALGRWLPFVEAVQIIPRRPMYAKYKNTARARKLMKSQNL